MTPRDRVEQAAEPKLDVLDAVQPRISPERSWIQVYLAASQHLTHNVRRGQMRTWSGFYGDVFNFEEQKYFNIKGKATGLFSQAMIAPDRFALVTQNVDGLHRRAGSPDAQTFAIHGDITLQGDGANAKGTSVYVHAASTLNSQSAGSSITVSGAQDVLLGLSFLKALRLRHASAGVADLDRHHAPALGPRRRAR